MPTPHDPRLMIGNRYGLLVVQSAIPREPGDRTETQFRCLCDCGNEILARGSRLRSGYNSSCGCVGYRRDAKRHAKARAKVPPAKRKQIARRGGKAARKRTQA